MDTTKFAAVGIAAGGLAAAVGAAFGFDAATCGTVAVVVSSAVTALLKKYATPEEDVTSFNSGYEAGYSDRGKDA